MRSIAIVNQKGGVGKTTTAVNLGAALAAAGKQVCLIDLDPQAHASLHLGVSPENGGESVYSVLIDGQPLAGVRRQVSDHLWLVPSHIDLAAAELELAGEVGREVILRDKLTEDPAPFDYLIVDCPPSLGLLALNALTAVDEVFLPLQPHFLALHGLSKLLRTIDVVSRRLNPRLRLSGVVLCMYDTGTRLAAEVAGDVTEFFAGEHEPGCPWSEVEIFQTRVRRNIRLAEAPSFGQSIFDYSANSHGAEDYRALAAEVLRQSAPDSAEPLPAAPRRR
jgi:chromosome partitioning protein